MSFPSGARIGPYEILSPLGAGGMGEVYRARDTRLGREVAIKVLEAEFSEDAGRLRRFEREARAASALNHPNIVTIHEVGTSDETAYLVMELVVGRTLREILRDGPLSVKKLLTTAASLADGLAAAHESGIVHRDLKPENVMISKDGIVKILDFGLAKLSAAVGSGESSLSTVTRTQPGGLLGTVSYMSPEQAAGQATDFRSDQFAFGAIVYELATGKKAFPRDTAVDTLAAILHEEPEPVAEARTDLPAPLVWLIERCLAKDPAGRYAATRDLARDLATLRERSSDAGLTSLPAASRAGRGSAFARWLVLSAVLAAGLFAGKLLWKSAPATPPTFHRLTFRRGTVEMARFAPDGQNVLYSARWGTDPERIFLTRADGGGGSLPLAFPDGSHLLAVSRTGEVALTLTDLAKLPLAHSSATLAVAPLTGGAPRALSDDIGFADWTPDGKLLAVNRSGRIEFPLGKMFTDNGDMPRVSPRGDRIAFGRSTGDVVHDRVVPEIVVADLAGHIRVVGHGQRNMNILWTPDGEEVWFATGPGYGATDTIQAATTSGKSRVVMRIPGYNMLQDLSRDGRLLLVTGPLREEAWWLPAGESVEREIGWFGGSHADALSADGRTVLINEFGEGGGAGTAYLRKADGSAPIKVTDGFGDALSPDAKWVACRRAGRILLVPTGSGETKTLEDARLESAGSLEFFPDGRRLLFFGNEKGKGGRLWIQEIAGGPPRPFTKEDEDCSDVRVSPDGRFVAARCGDVPRIHPADGGPYREMPGIREDEQVLAWTEDSRAVYVSNSRGLPFHVFRIDVMTGRREPWKTIGPADATGIFWSWLRMAPNGAYALTFGRYLSDLYLVEGLK